MSATFTDIKLTLQRWEPTNRTNFFHFTFNLSSAPDKVWQDAFQQLWNNINRIESTLIFTDANLSLTIESFISDSLLVAIKECAKQANLASRRHLAYEEETSFATHAEEATREAEKKKLDSIFQELKAKFNNS
jgi:hypothetical protein